MMENDENCILWGKKILIYTRHIICQPAGNISTVHQQRTRNNSHINSDIMDFSPSSGSRAVILSFKNVTHSRPDETIPPYVLDGYRNVLRR